jgi:hypothetical protein
VKVRKVHQSIDNLFSVISSQFQDALANIFSVQCCRSRFLPYQVRQNGRHSPELLFPPQSQIQGNVSADSVLICVSNLVDFSLQQGGDYWCCAQRGCKVRLISSRVNHESGRMEFSRRNQAIQHEHEPNAPNLIEKEFRRQLVTQFDRVTANKSGSPQSATPVSVRLVYDELRSQAIKRGVPESLIPSYWNIRSTMYRIRRKRVLLHVPSSNSGSERRGVYSLCI